MIGTKQNLRPLARFDVLSADRMRPVLGRSVAVAVGLTCLLSACSTANEDATTTPEKVPLAASSTPKLSLKELEAGGVGDAVVAVVDGDPITLRELKTFAVKGAPFLPADARSDTHALLDSMIEQRLLRAEYKKNGISANDVMVNRYIDSVLEENHQPRAALKADIAKAGLTWESYFERMRDEVQRIQLVNMLIRSRVNIPEEEVRRAWEENPQYLQSAKLNVAVIFIPSPVGGEGAEKAQQLANEVQAQAKGNFAKAAKEHSKGPGASDGGELGQFERGTMAPHYEKALDGLGEGDVSVPIEGPGGLYIVKLLDVSSAGRQPFEEVKDKLADKLYDERLNQRYEKWLSEDLRKNHRIEYLVGGFAVDAAGS